MNAVLMAHPTILRGILGSFPPHGAWTHLPPNCEIPGPGPCSPHLGIPHLHNRRHPVGSRDKNMKDRRVSTCGWLKEKSQMTPKFLMSPMVLPGRAVGLGEGEVITGRILSWRGLWCPVASGSGNSEAMVWRDPPGTVWRETKVDPGKSGYIWKQGWEAITGGHGRRVCTKVQSQRGGLQRGRGRDVGREAPLDLPAAGSPWAEALW